MACVVYDVKPSRLVLLLGLAALPAAALAAPSPAPVPSPSDQVRDGGTLDAKITTVDFQRNEIGVDARGHGHLTVTVMPSTSIQGKDSAYHTFTDLKAGQHVQIMSSIAGGKYVAQIIRIQ